MNNETDAFKYSETPKLQSGCSGCDGYVTNCQYCGRTVELRDGKCFDHQSATLHRCGYGRYQKWPSQSYAEAQQRLLPAKGTPLKIGIRTCIHSGSRKWQPIQDSIPTQRESHRQMKQKPTFKIKLPRTGPQLPRRVEESIYWTPAAIADELTITMRDTKTFFCLINRSDFESGSLPRSLYIAQARYKMYRIPVFRPPLPFVIYLKHLDERLKKELVALDKQTRDDVIREAIGRICEQVNRRYFMLSVEPLLTWRLEN